MKMLTVSVVLMILLSTALGGYADNHMNCDIVEKSLKQLEKIQLSMKNDFPPKPISGKLVSYCSSFDHTCCNKGLEEKLAKETNRNFKQDLDYVVTAQRMYCTKMKTSLPSAIQDAFTESFLAGVIHPIVSTNITGNIRQLLQPLYSYFTKYVNARDICSLPGTIDLQLLKFAKQVFHDKVGDSPCFEATMREYNVKFVRSIMEQLEPLLGKLRYLLEVYEYRNKIIKFMSSYQAPPHCIKSLMMMTFCSTCTTGIIPMFPCHNLCLNTIQGCLIDWADLHLSVKTMVKMMDKMTSQLHLSSNLNHVGIKLQRYILGLKNDSTLIKQKLIANNCLPANYKRDLMSNELFFTPNVADILPPLITNTTDLILTDAISSELKCIRHMTLLNAPNKMCTERYGTKMKNSNCWSASPAPGYAEPVADFSRHAMQQNLNPVFQDMAIPEMSVLNKNITRFIKEMRDMDFQLHCSDDEDCKKFPYLTMAMCEDEEFSGSGVDSGNDKDEPTSSGSMPTPRVNIAIVTRPPNTNISLPPNILYTNSTPTTASPNTEPEISTIANISTNTSHTSNDVSGIKISASPITRKQKSGITILHSQTSHLLLPMLLGILYIF